MIHHIQFDLVHGWPWWGAVLITLAVVAAMALFYRRAASRVSRRYLIVLMALRCVAMGALLLCLFRPTIHYQRGTIMRPTLLVMADTSKSMSVHDFAGQAGRFERVREALGDNRGPARELEENFDVLWFAFASRAQALKSRREYADKTAEEEATDLVASVKDALGKVKTSDIGGVVLLTDGINTTPSNPDADLPALGVPFFTVGVGSVLGRSENYRDIGIDHVDARRDIAVKTTLPITVHVAAVGFPDRVVPIVLKEDDREVAREDLVLDNKPGLQKVLLKYTPQNKGDFELTVAIPTDPSERVTENNLSKIPVWVGDPRMRVLYVEGVIRNEYRSLRRVLQLDPQVEVLSLLRTGKNLFYQQGNVKDVQLNGFPSKYDDLKAFKIVILGSIESEAFSKEQMGLLRQFVADGGGFMMLGGENSYGPGGFANTPIAEMLPVDLGGLTDGQERAPFPLTLTASGQAHPIFAGIADFFAVENVRQAAKTPDLLGCVKVLRPKPAADVLAVNPRRRTESGALVALAAGRYGSGRVLACTFDSTYLWYVPMRGLGQDSPFVRFWGQSMRWLAGADETRRKAGAGVTAFADRRFYEPGMKPMISARITNAEGQVTEKAQAEAVLVRQGEAGEKKFQLSPVEGRRGDYETAFDALPPGRYAVKVRANLSGADLGEAEVIFRVGEPTREFEKLDLNEAGLRAIASASKGRYVPFLSFGKLPEIIRSRQEEKIEKGEIFLWNSPILFVAFLMFLTVEWVLRKRRLLS